MGYAGQPSEKAAVVATIDPQSANNTSLNSDWVDMGKFQEALFVLLVGAIDSTIDFLVQEAKDASGTGAQTLSGKSITQFAATDDNKQAAVNVKSEELSSDYQFVRGRATLGNGTAQLVAAIGLGMSPRFGPASDDDLADVKEIV